MFSINVLSRPLVLFRATNGVHPKLAATDDEALSALLAMSKAKSGRRSAVYSGAKR